MGRHASHQTPAELDAGAGAVLMLICRAGTRRFAVPVESVIETMRPLPAGPLPGLPAYVIGVSQIRGEAVPVIDTLRLLDGASSAQPDDPAPQRLVTISLPGRVVALAVTEVLGVDAVPAGAVATLAPLLAGGSGGVLTGIATVDGDLMLVLDQARLLPEESWAALDAVPAQATEATGEPATATREVTSP